MKTTLAAAGLLLCLFPCASSGMEGPQEFPPSIEDTIRIDEWRFLGPFSVGYREGAQGVVPRPGDLVPPGGGPGAAAPAEYRSILRQGGAVRWRHVSPDSTGWVSIEFDSVYWDTIMNVYGYAGLVNKTFAYAEIDVPAECRALVVAERIGTFFINSVEYGGDPYAHGFMRVPVVLGEGKNRVVLSLSGFAGHRFRFELLPVPAPVMLLDDYTTPDLLEGETGMFHIGVTVLNTTAAAVDDAVLTVGDGAAVPRKASPVGPIAPLCVKKVPVAIQVISPPDGRREVVVPVAVACAAGASADSMRLRVRGPGESFKRTFISRIDGSCQYFAVLPPEGYTPGRRYALILSLHGAGVRAEGLVDAYKPKPWAFVVAPTNRRPFGFDWQDWGRLDALEVLGIARDMFPIDTTRVYLTGHSMGGHGVWHVGLNHPGLFAAMAPGAGWTSFQLYIPWFLQKSYIYGDPRAVGMRDLALRQDRPLDFVENAFNTPVFILHGGDDDNVPTMHGRMFAERLEELGYAYTYLEVPGRGHWWHDDSLDVSCADLPVVMDFMRSHARRRQPREVRFKTVSLGTSRRAFWVEIGAQDEVMRETEIHVAVPARAAAAGDATLITVCTRNVAGFTLAPPPDLVPPGPVTVRVDGEDHALMLRRGDRLAFSKRGGGFRPGRTEKSSPFKSPDLYGPIKQAYFTPFILVYGTRGGPTTARGLLDQARRQAFRWWRRGNGCVEVVPDTLVTDRIIDTYNLILFGGPGENGIVARMARRLPVRAATGRGEGGIEIGAHLIRGRGLAAEFVYPNPLNPEKLVVVHLGADAAGLALSDFFKVIHSGAGLPDYIIFDESVRTKGWAGVVCAGFFDEEWRPDPALMFLAR